MTAARPDRHSLPEELVQRRQQHGTLLVHPINADHARAIVAALPKTVPRPVVIEDATRPINQFEWTLPQEAIP